MKQNIGATDRWIRVALGIVLLALTVIGPKTAWGYLGFLPLFTGIIGYCPAYSLLGWSSNTKKSAPAA